MIEAARLVALLVCTIALVTETLARRGRGFPLGELVRDRFPRSRVSVSALAVGVAAGAGSVLIPVLWSMGSGRAGIEPTGTPLLVHLILASLLVKLVWVVAEELIFRGALLPLAARPLGSSAAILLSALIFALVHQGRSAAGFVVLALDGIGFGTAFVLTGALWTPVAWHMTKNVAVWLLGGGTLQLTDGPFSVRYMGGADAGAGWADVAVTAVVVAGATVALLRQGTRVRGELGSGRTSAPPAAP